MMDVILAGGLMRFFQGLASAAPTMIVGLFVAGLLRYYLGTAGTIRLFGGNGLRSLPQSWLIGMLLPVCSIGVIPILREMRRMGIRPGAITAFALSAPLFNPLSLLYGLTLSRPYVIVGFAFASLGVVTALGMVWDRMTVWKPIETPKEPEVIGLRRLVLTFFYMAREWCGPTGGLTMIALFGLFLLGALLPHGALQSSVEQLDPLAPLKMAVVAIPIYAPPMLTMSQLGMMFAHGNSPGAAFCLLLLGTGVNLATLWWIATSYGLKPTLIWFTVLFTVVVGFAYAVERPLIPPGVEPAGHTHAFDVYTNPLHSDQAVTAAFVLSKLADSVGLVERIGVVMLIALAIFGWVIRFRLHRLFERLEAEKMEASKATEQITWNRVVSPRTVGITCLVGLVAFSVVACYAYYPPPGEVLEEMRLARTEVLSGAVSRDYQRALHWIPILEEWSRKLEVGHALRHLDLRPYQQMQSQILRKKLELLEHAIEHASQANEHSEGIPASKPEIDLDQELREIDQLRWEISLNAQRLVRAFH
jgi:uncharacterized protein